MNRETLWEIFDRYAEGKTFDYINNETNDEIYKWIDAAAFGPAFDLDAEDFTEVLSLAKKNSGNIIDSYVQPLGGLYAMARDKGEAETIRAMFRALYAEDDGNPVTIQEKIDAFLKSCKMLLEKHYPNSYLYQNDQRSAMAYLWLYQPNKYFLYKATEAKYFAACIEFFEDWGTYADFKLDVYMRFCNEIIAEMRNHKALMEVQKKRFLPDRWARHAGKELHKDEALHILLFDVIYCTKAYRLCPDKVFPNKKLIEQQEQEARREKIRTLKAALAETEEKIVLLAEARATFESMLRCARVAVHKTWGEGQLVAAENCRYTFFFPSIQEEKKVTISAFANGMMTIAHPEFATLIEQSGHLMKQELELTRSFGIAKAKYEPYKDEIVE